MVGTKVVIILTLAYLLHVGRFNEAGVTCFLIAILAGIGNLYLGPRR